ncbi:MAG: metallophosphoesterase [Candidatus Lokiarchaeota archaeon]|nr:metallophosphoesterase [Candidatus Harpocratesius repetitus]
MGEKIGKILIISDVHAKIPEMTDFFHMMNEKEDIDFAVHLGDFWSGRNFNPELKTQVKNEWHDLTYFEKFPFPLFHIRGNEDLTQPDDWWNFPKMHLMKDQEPFLLNGWKVLPIDYQYRGEETDNKARHPEFSEKDGFDMIFSHRPAYGLLDDTLHFKTHQKLSKTGSPMIRDYYDRICPPLMLFGHFHYSNFMQTDCGLIVCIDKLIRVGGKNHDELRYSYALLDPFDQSLQVVWKNNLFLKYSILEQKILIANKLDSRNLYKPSHRLFRRKNKEISEEQYEEEDFDLEAENVD